jgi:AcrR family transcriptional regulator
MTETAAANRSVRAGLRERKKLATRQALSQAALRLAIERGLDNVLVEDIAAEVDVSTRTFNNYFHSKQQAICALGVDRSETLGAALRARPADEDLWEAITEALLEHYDDSANEPDRDWFTAARLVMSAPSLQGEYLKVTVTTQRVLAEAIAERAGLDNTKDMLPMILAGAITAACQVAVERWMMTAETPTSLQDLLRDALHQLAVARQPTAQSPRRNKKMTRTL